MGKVLVEDSYWVLTETAPVSVEVSLLKKPPSTEIWATVFEDPESDARDAPRP